MGLAALHLRRGDLERAEAAVSHVLALESARLEIIDHLQIRSSAALVAVHAGRDAEAREQARRALEAAVQLPAYVTEFIAQLTWLMEVLVLLWQRAAAAGSPDVHELEQQARMVCQLGLKKVRRLPVMEPDSCYWLGECEWLAGHPKKARTLWLRAAARAQALDLPYQRALAERALLRGAAS